MLAQFQHLFFGAEVNSPGRTSFDAGRFLAHADAIDAERTFINAVVLFVEARNIKRTPGDTVTTADTVFRLKINNPVRVLDDSPGRRTGFKTAWIFTVHTTIFTNQPLQLAVLLGFGKAHHRPGLGAEIGRVIVHPDTMTNVIANIVPFRTGYLAGFTADTGGDVDQFRDFSFVITRLRRRRDGVCCGPFNNVLRFHRHMFASLTPSRC
ncbi:Uncharacterised protein [Salmonella enterica subsp. enterica serovar Bovismorbificans]|uniref:Uncharacterized protein n=1 Tax=Salmonella enterica subsp. enterica serovar Bovismorbificans TaxID=58097 RepID=A0A655ESY3_SALET|nr:Uncharacterised protein [Salmonella enterica subsp. enterica serovar Bovismorbificans]